MGDDYGEFFCFAIEPNNLTLQTQMLNHLDLLKHFILYFKDHFETTIKQLMPYKDQSIDLLKLLPDKQIHWTAEQQQAFLAQTSIKHLVFDTVQFSSQQTRIIKHLLNFQTSVEIGSQLGLSPRTVEAYIEEIKNKLGCSNRAELLSKLEMYKNLI